MYAELDDENDLVGNVSLEALGTNSDAAHGWSVARWCDHGDMRQDLTGLVLAGGRSRRMGTDKALVEIAGRPLVRRIAERLAAVCTEVLVAPGERRLWGLPWQQVDDRVSGEGPLAGILGGLHVAGTPLMAVAAVDMPAVDGGLYRTLADAWDGRQVAVVPVADGRPQPLHAVYATASLPQFAALFDAGERSPTRALQRLDVMMVDVPGRGSWAVSLDTPDDLAAFDAGRA